MLNGRITPLVLYALWTDVSLTRTYSSSDPGSEIQELSNCKEGITV